VSSAVLLRSPVTDITQTVAPSGAIASCRGGTFHGMDARTRPAAVSIATMRLGNDWPDASIPSTAA
jgi:hypothetical protein